MRRCVVLYSIWGHYCLSRIFKCPIDKNHLWSLLSCAVTQCELLRSSANTKAIECALFSPQFMISSQFQKQTCFRFLNFQLNFWFRSLKRICYWNISNERSRGFFLPRPPKGELDPKPMGGFLERSPYICIYHCYLKWTRFLFYHRIIFRTHVLTSRLYIYRHRTDRSVIWHD